MLDYKMFSLRVSDETRFVIVAKCNTKYGTRMFIISTIVLYSFGLWANHERPIFATWLCQ